MNPTQLTSRIKALLAFFMTGLVISGLTAIPLLYELTILNDFSSDQLGSSHPIALWVGKVLEGLRYTYDRYPFIAYGTDWLAFAHFVLAIVFIGPFLNPVKNKWVIQFGMIACVLVIPFALIAGIYREIPIFWRAIDCLFGITGFIPLWICHRYITILEKKNGNDDVKKNAKLKILIGLCYLIFVSFSLVEMRIIIAQKMTYIFLLWNLFLALLPLLIIFAARHLIKRTSLLKNSIIIFLLGLWLLFFPNAPYVITDFIHLKTLPSYSLWLDGLLVSLFALASLLSGIISLVWAFETFRSFIKIPEPIFLIICSVLGGLGVYLGRFLRWNSWDVFKDPFYYAWQGMLQLTHPFALKITFLFALILMAGYLILKKVFIKSLAGNI